MFSKKKKKKKKKISFQYKEPIIDEFISYIEMNEGETLILPCRVNGYPKPTVSWFKNHHKIDTFDRRIIIDKNFNTIHNLFINLK